MLKKYITPKFITLFCFIVSITELINNQFFFTINNYVNAVKQFINPLSVGWILSRDLNASDGFNSINTIFDLLLLLGAILYVFNKTRETRLIRFVMSVIFISNVLSLLYSLALILFADIHRPLSSILLSIAFYIAHACWIYLSYNILQYFNTQNELQKDVIEEGETVHTYFVEASKWTRFLHPVIDVIVTIMLFSRFVELIAYIKFGQAMFIRLDYSASPTPLLLMLALCRLIYYLLFESVLGITPGKLLTETRVINYEGNKPSLKNVAVRSIVRFIPFESLTFLQHNGLHDKLSHTLVVKEKKTGIDGSYFFWIFPAIIVFHFVSNMVQSEYNSYERKQYFRSLQDRMQGELINKFKNVDTNDFFQLKHTWGQSNESEYTSDFLKVEHVTPKAIVFSLVKVDSKNYRGPTEAEVEAFYNNYKGTLPVDTISKESLLKALQAGDATYIDLPDTIVPIKVSNMQYLISSIDPYFMPNIQISDFAYSNNYFTLVLINKGWVADVTKVQVLEGSIEMTTHFPVHLGKSLQRIGGAATGDKFDYKLDITVRDSLKREYIFRVEGNTSMYGDRSIWRIK